MKASSILRLELSILDWVPSPCVVKNNLELLTLLTPVKVTGYNIPDICHQASAYVGHEPRALRCLASTLSVELCTAQAPIPSLHKCLSEDYTGQDLGLVGSRVL